MNYPVIILIIIHIILAGTSPTSAVEQIANKYNLDSGLLYSLLPDKYK